MQIRAILMTDDIGLSIRLFKTTYHPKYKYCFDLQILILNIYIVFKKKINEK